eukprot:s4506_g6.t1
MGRINAGETDDLISKAICAAVAECDFSVAIADPTGLDFELIAVSEEFHRLTGYSPEESVGENCRFLNSGCPNDAGAALRLACETGAPFTSILVNRRKSGEFFLNLLSMRGLVIATDSATGEDIWILVSVQRDVSLLPAADLPSNDACMLKVANRITRRLYKYATELGIASIIHSSRGRVTNGDSNGSAKLAGMHMLAEVTWKLGEQMGQCPLDALKFLPADFLHLRGAPLESEEPKDGDGELVEHQPGPKVAGNSSPHWPMVVAGSSFAALMLLLLCRHARRSVQNVRPEVSLDGDGCDGFAFDEEELNAALGKLEKLDIFAAATPTSTDCPDEELMDFLDEDEKEAENEPSEEDLVVPVISNTSAIRRCRLREDRRQMVREYLAKHGFQDANQPKSTHSSFFRTETIYPIHQAAKLGHHLMVRELLRFGVDREVTTSRGRTAYDLAAEADKLGSHRTVLDLLSGVWNSTTLRDLREIGSSHHLQDSKNQVVHFSLWLAQNLRLMLRCVAV